MQVTIGPEFFKKARQDYSNWRMAWVREILQNAMDSGASNIDFQYEFADSSILAVVSDDGCGMTQDILINKLFSLGASGKDFKGTVGGFGKAKELLYFCQHKYEIKTNDLLVFGSGGEYHIQKSNLPRKGTESRVWIDTTERAALVGFTKKLVSQSAFKGACTINGEVEAQRTPIGELVKEFTCGKLYKIDGHLDEVIVRVSGSPMYSYTIPKLGYGLAIELNVPCVTFLSSNRDGLSYEARGEIDPFIAELTIDKRTALIRQTATITYYKGRKGGLCSRKNLAKRKEVTTLAEVAVIEKQIEESIANALEKKIEKTSFKAKVEFQKMLTEYDFISYHAKVEPLPEKWKVGTMCDNAQWVAWAWSVAVWEIFKVAEREPDFTFGFIFDDDVAAVYARESGGFLLNPCHTDYKIKWTRNRKSCCDLLVIAAHEFCHSVGYSWHDEDFAKELTNLCMKILFRSPGIITKMLSRTAQAALAYDSESNLLDSIIESVAK